MSSRSKGYSTSRTLSSSPHLEGLLEVLPGIRNLSRHQLLLGSCCPPPSSSAFLVRCKMKRSAKYLDRPYRMLHQSTLQWASVLCQCNRWSRRGLKGSSYRTTVIPRRRVTYWSEHDRYFPDRWTLKHISSQPVCLWTAHCQRVSSIRRFYFNIVPTHCRTPPSVFPSWSSCTLHSSSGRFREEWRDEYRWVERTACSRCRRSYRSFLKKQYLILDFVSPCLYTEKAQVGTRLWTKRANKENKKVWKSH